MASPFSSPPSTPSSPGIHTRSSESEESPISFEQPPEGSHLQSYTKVRTRGSIKRRPPSRKFRRSQGDLDFDVDQVNATPKENGDKAEAEDAGNSEEKVEPSSAETPQGTDTTSQDPAPEPSAKPQSDTGETEKAGDTEVANEERPPDKAEEQGEHLDKEGETPETNGTDKPVTKEETVTGNAEHGGDGTNESQEEGGEHSKSDADDKPEK